MGDGAELGAILVSCLSSTFSELDGVRRRFFDLFGRYITGLGRKASINLGCEDLIASDTDNLALRGHNLFFYTAVTPTTYPKHNTII